jgi:hypothetical protein
LRGNRRRAGGRWPTWVDRRLEDSDDTVVGRHVHRAVDKETGAAAVPEDGDLLAAWSLTLSSPSLRLISRLDLVAGAGGDVVPVDYKKGSHRSNGTAWPTDEVQVCIQGIAAAGERLPVRLWGGLLRRGAAAGPRPVRWRADGGRPPHRRGGPCSRASCGSAVAADRQPEVPSLLARRHLTPRRDQRPSRAHAHAAAPAGPPRPGPATGVRHGRERLRRGTGRGGWR